MYLINQWLFSILVIILVIHISRALADSSQIPCAHIGLKRVVDFKSLPQSLKKSARLASVKFVSLLVAFVMLMMGCAPNTIYVAVTPSLNSQGAMQAVSNSNGAPELHAETPVITESPVPTETPFSSPYFVFCPTEEELKELEKVANEYGKRLEGNHDGEAKFRRSSGAYFQLAKNLCGYFDNLDFNSCKSEEELENAKNEIYEYMCGYLETFTVISMSIDLDLSSEEKKSITFCNIDTAKVYNSVEGADFSGVTTLELLEDNLYNIQKSGFSGDKNKVESYGRDLVNMLQLIFLDNGGTYKGNEILAFSNMYPTIQLFVKRISQISMFEVCYMLQTFSITMEDSTVYNMKDLYTITLKDKDPQQIEPRIKEAIFALMDAYIYAVKSGQITVVGSSESPQLILTPSPTPEM